MVKAVHFSACKNSAQWTGFHIGIGMLNQQLNKDAEHQYNCHILRNTYQQQWAKRNNRVHQLKNRVLHYSVESVESFGGVVYGMKTPKKPRFVAEQMKESRADIEHHNGQQDLGPEGPILGPDCRPQGESADQWQQKYPDVIAGLIDRKMQAVAKPVSQGAIPLAVVGNDALHGK